MIVRNDQDWAAWDFANLQALQLSTRQLIAQLDIASRVDLPLMLQRHFFFHSCLPWHLFKPD